MGAPHRARSVVSLSVALLVALAVVATAAAPSAAFGQPVVAHDVALAKCEASWKTCTEEQEPSLCLVCMGNCYATAHGDSVKAADAAKYYRACNHACEASAKLNGM
eukprot:TRINITY_DN1215_c0_g1_i3.p2 TRINITY_DN1215_c0_g1~~TRINITY_DN1215_c0_g1_i3.p2  ORF type:complete len:119 (+),score=38.80 TRINITY_DN1215_c0_g1_i3:41-358(+)